MKRKTAKELLAESFCELAETKNIDKITIQNIVDNCGYSRATFYRNFRDKYELIAWYHAEKMRDIRKRVGTEGYTWRDAYRDGTEYYRAHKALLANLFRHTGGMDSFIEHMTEINYESYRDYLLQREGGESLDKKSDLMLRLYCIGAAHFVSDWVQDKVEATAEELTEALEKSFPLALSLEKNETNTT